MVLSLSPLRKDATIYNVSPEKLTLGLRVLLFRGYELLNGSKGGEETEFKFHLPSSP